MWYHPYHPKIPIQHWHGDILTEIERHKWQEHVNQMMGDSRYLPEYMTIQMFKDVDQNRRTWEQAMKIVQKLQKQQRKVFDHEKGIDNELIGFDKLINKTTNVQKLNNTLNKQIKKEERDKNDTNRTLILLSETADIVCTQVKRIEERLGSISRRRDQDHYQNQRNKMHLSTVKGQSKELERQNDKTQIKLMEHKNNISV